MTQIGQIFRSWATVLCFLAAAVLSPAWAGDEGGQGKGDGNKDRDGRSENQETVNVKFITVVTTDSRQFKIDWVVVADGRSTVFADASKGVSQENQDRIDLSFIPFLGGVTKYRYTAADVSAQTRIGSAWILENILLVALGAEWMNALSPPRIVVLNGIWAFNMRTPAMPDHRPSQSELAAFGVSLPLRDFATPNASTPDARAILVAGLDSQEKIVVARRVPALGDIPTLGRYFIGSVHQRDNMELVIVVKPTIIAPDE